MGITTTVAVGEKFTVDLKAGETVSFFVALEAKKYTFKCDGTANVVVGIYNKDRAVGNEGLVRIAGVAKWGCRLIPGVGSRLVVVKAVTDGSFTFVADSYWIFDEIGLRFTHKSG